MTGQPPWRRHPGAALAAIALISLGAACHRTKTPALPAPGSMAPDQFLYERGTAEVAAKHWVAGREYLERLVNTYPQSTFRADAKLGVADSYLGENRIDSDILAVNQYREFISFFPTNAKADYAQYQICVGQSREMLTPERDQTATNETIKQVDLFLTTFPSSKYVPDVQKLRRKAQDRLSEHEYDVGMFQFRIHAYGGAINRFEYLLQHDPEYTSRDKVYFYLGECWMKGNAKAAALPFFDKLVQEFPNSKLAPEAKKRIAEIKH